MAPMAIEQPQVHQPTPSKTSTYGTTSTINNTITAPAVQPLSRTGSYQGYDNVHWYVGNAKQTGTLFSPSILPLTS